MIMLNVPFRLVQKSMAALKAPENDNQYMFKDPKEAMAMSEEIAATGAVCEGIHSHVVNDETMWMPCKDMEQFDSAVGEKSLEIIKGADEEEYGLTEEEIGNGVLIEVPVSSGVTDRDGDIVDPEAVMKAWDGYKKNPIILHNHERGGIGKMVSVTMGEWPGLDHKVPIGRALIDGNEKDIVHKVRKGIIRAFSIGFISKDDGLERMADEDGRISHRFTDIDWVETSVVDIPSNPMALFDVVKSAMKVQTKGAAPDSFNNPFSMWIVRTGETMTDDSTQEVEAIDETLVDTPVDEAPLVVKESVETTTLDEEVTESDLEDPEEDLTEAEETVSPEQFKAMQEKVDAVIDAVLSLKDMSPDPATVTDDTDEVAQMKSELAALRAEKEAAEVEAKIAAEVEARVKSIMGDTPTDAPVRTPERKSISGSTEISQEVFTALAEERKTSVGAIKGEAWLSTLLASRRKQ